MNSLVTGNSLTFNSGIHLRTADCQSNGQAEVGFITVYLMHSMLGNIVGNVAEKI